MVVGLYNSSGDIVDAVTTESNGRYLFTQVFPGEPFKIGVVVDEVYEWSPVVADGNVMTRYDATLGTSDAIVLEEGTFRDNVHGGVWRPTTIGNKVWEDLDGDGLQGPGEPGIENVKVTLKKENGDVVDETLTDSDGLYLFEGLPPMKYGT